MIGSDWIASDTVADDRRRSVARSGRSAADTLAFLQYTSGSTATPKGVMITHGNLLQNLTYAFHLGDADSSSVSVSWLPVIHDMGLIEGVLQPAFSGCPAYLMAPAAFLQRPIRWLNAIARYAATRSGGTKFRVRPLRAASWSPRAGSSRPDDVAVGLLRCRTDPPGYAPRIYERVCCLWIQSLFTSSVLWTG